MWIKICGIRDVATAERVAAMSPDAVGLNFYSKSPRAVSSETAAQIVSLLPKSVQAVGVFVNASLADIVQTATNIGLTMVQLHGDEPPEFLAELRQELPDVPLLRAWRMGADLNDWEDYLRNCARLQIALAGCLMDAKVSGSYGGTGQTPPWDILRAAYQRESWPPLILAGGLTPDNVADGIRSVHPWGVDVASGVESAPGVKDLLRVAKFIAAARGP